MARPPALPSCRLSREETGALEAWLQHGLADRFGAAVSETLPAELVLLAARLFH